MVQESTGFRFTISKKLFAGFVTQIGLVCVVGLIGLYFITEIETKLNEITDVSAPTVETADDLVMNIWEATKVAEEIIADEELEDVQALRTEFYEFEEAFKVTYQDLEALVTDESLLDELARIEEVHGRYIENSTTMINAHIEELEEEAKADILLEGFDQIGGELIIMLDEFANENEAEMQAVENRGDALVASGQATASQLNDLLGSLFEEDYPVVEAALKLQRIVMEMQDTAGEYMAIEDPADLPASLENFQALANGSQQYFDILHALAESEEDKSDAVQLTETFERWVSTARQDEQLFDTHRDYLSAEQIADEFTEKLEMDADALADVLDVVGEKADSLNDSADEEAAAVVGNAIAMIAAGIAGAAGIGLFLILFTNRTVIRDLNKISDVMTRFAENDLEHEVPGVGRPDEIGDMAGSVQVFKVNAVEMQRLQEEQKLAEARAEEERRKTMDNLASTFESTVLGIVDQVSTAASSLETTSVEMANSAAKTLVSAQEVDSKSSEASQSVDSVADNTDELSKSIVEISSQIDHSTRIAEKAVVEAQRSGEIINGLEQAVHSINSVVSLINDIAEQTNLLALNATIEAARAGDAGKGFAVVASEVKNLATQTAKATSSIIDEVASIQNESKEAVNAIQSIQTVIGEISDISTSIASAMEQQTAATNEISRSVDVTKVSSKTVANDIATVIDATRATESAAKQVLDSSNGLVAQSSTLKEEVQEFLKKARMG